MSWYNYAKGTTHDSKLPKAPLRQVCSRTPSPLDFRVKHLGRAITLSFRYQRAFVMLRLSEPPHFCSFLYPNKDLMEDSSVHTAS